MLAQGDTARLDDDVVVRRDRPLARDALRRPRSSTHRSMSISALSVNSGTVAFDEAIRRATTCWARVGSRSVTNPLPARLASPA